MNRDRKKKQKEPYNKATNNKGKNGTNNVRWKKGKFKGNGNGLSDTRGNRRNNTSYGFSNRNSSVKFRVTLDGSGDVSKGRGRNNNNNNNNRNKRNNNRRRQRAPPVMKPQPRSEDQPMIYRTDKFSPNSPELCRTKRPYLHPILPCKYKRTLLSCKNHYQSSHLGSM